MVSAICQNCRILVVEANSASDADLGIAVNEAVKLGAIAVSNLFIHGWRRALCLPDWPWQPQWHRLFLRDFED